MRKLLFLLSILLQVAAVSVSAQSNLGNWEDYEPLDSREFRDIAERSSKGLLDISVNTTDPGFYKNIRISDNTTIPESAPFKNGPKTGDTISGVVFNDEWPMMMVNVTERDSKERIVAHAITDFEGKFSFRLVNPENKIEVTYIGYDRVELPIDKTYYEIKMNKSPEQYLDDIVYASRPAEMIDMSKEEYLKTKTVDEVLQGKVASYDIIMLEYGDLAYGPPIRSLMEKMNEEIKNTPLVAFDFREKKDIDKARLESFDFENCYNDRDSLASLLGVKKSKLKAVRYLKDAKAMFMWGRDGANGVIEIVTKKQYRKYRKEGKLEEDWQLLK